MHSYPELLMFRVEMVRPAAKHFGAKWVKLRCSDVFDNRLSPRRYILETLYKHRLCAIWPAQHGVFVGPDECPNRAVLRDDEHGTSFACMSKVDS
jgi:hypothetical protein